MNAGASIAEQTDLIRLSLVNRLDQSRQAELGQFLTPAHVARLMAELLELKSASIRLLDAGAGIGSLTAAVVDVILLRPRRPTRFHVDAYELDATIIPHLRETLTHCTARLRSAGIDATYSIVEGDFIKIAGDAIRPQLFGKKIEPYSTAILNPPYHKVQTGSAERTMLEDVGIPVVNLYTAFLGVSAKLLMPGGELVAITPRSFCNGPYHGPFRKFFLDSMALKSLVLFDSRRAAFKEDAVLQENIIFHSVKSAEKPDHIVVLKTSGHANDAPSVHNLPYEQAVDPQDPQQFIHVVEDATDGNIQSLMRKLPARLASLGLTVSTGPVVDFRADDLLLAKMSDNAAPLLFPHHVKYGRIEWPGTNDKKPSAIRIAADRPELLVPNEVYVLLKRFTAKEEKRRIVSAVITPTDTSGKVVGLENHLNYIHRNGRGLDEDLARGLSAFLNSTVADRYFRMFSGHTQVNATDIRMMPLPDEATLRALGQSMTVGASQAVVDTLVQTTVFSHVDTGGVFETMKRTDEALDILKQLGLPKAQQNERSALTLLALLDLTPDKPWKDASAPLIGISPIIDFIADKYKKQYAENTRETVRRQTVHQFVDAGLILINPDEPTRPTNSPKTVYRVSEEAIKLLRVFGTAQWEEEKKQYLTVIKTLKEKYAQEREMQRIPLTLPDGKQITLSAGGQNVLVAEIIRQFAERFTPGGIMVYIGDTDEKFAHFDAAYLKSLGVTIEAHGRMPDVVIHDVKRNWLLLIEAVTSHGPVNPKRHLELKKLFGASKAGLVFVTTFLDRKSLLKYLPEIAWETEVWVAESPSHMIHFNGERFLGPYSG